MLRDRYEPVDDDQIFARVRDDLSRRYPLTRVHGRRSTPVEVILRMLVVMRLYGWSFQKTEYFVNDTTLIRWAKLVGPETLQKLNDRAVELAKGRQVTRGRKLRVDTTAVETEIHYPTD